MTAEEISDFRLFVSAFNSRMDSLDKSIHELKETMGDSEKLQQTFEIWKATTDVRLHAGVERMDSLKSEIDKNRLENATLIASIKNEYVEKKVVIAYLIGTASAGGAIGAGLLKLLQIM